MPSFVSLPDEQVAAVLDLSAKPGRRPKEAFTVAEVTAGRAKPAKTGSDVLAERAALVKSGVVK